MSEHILIVEDDPSILVGLRMNLEMEGYVVSTATDGNAAIELFSGHKPDLVLLDLMLPELNGFEVLEWIRAQAPETQVMILSARDAQSDKILGLDLGADDYITKPFQLSEVLARINARLRVQRLRASSQAKIEFGEISIDTSARVARRAGEALEMTAREFDVLLYLARRPNRVVSRAQIIENVWGDDYEGTERTVDNFVVRLRNKIERSPDEPRHIQTVRGVGYRFTP